MLEFFLKLRGARSKWHLISVALLHRDWTNGIRMQIDPRPSKKVQQYCFLATLIASETKHLRQSNRRQRRPRQPRQRQRQRQHQPPLKLAKPRQVSCCDWQWATGNCLGLAAMAAASHRHGPLKRTRKPFISSYQASASMAL
ncbi:hypothetical protein ACLKA7_010874 [Drosophila subpalustris]